jgi:hypothetical protein
MKLIDCKKPNPGGCFWKSPRPPLCDSGGQVNVGKSQKNPSPLSRSGGDACLKRFVGGCGGELFEKFPPA